MRAYPGRPWQRNVIGMREDFDPRFRPWFVGATSGPKDVVIVLDMSRSMGDFRGRRYVKDTLSCYFMPCNMQCIPTGVCT